MIVFSRFPAFNRRERCAVLPALKHVPIRATSACLLSVCLLSACLLVGCLLSGCGSAETKEVDYTVEGSRPNKPKVLIPQIPQEENASSEAPVSQKTASREIASDEAVSGKIASDEAASEKIASDEAASEKIASDEAASEKIASDEAVSGKTASDEAASGKIVSDKAASGETASRGGEAKIIGNDEVEIDVSHTADGYLCARYLGDAPKIKFQMSSGDSATYTYNLNTDGRWCVFPLSNGSGDYLIAVYTNVEATLYAECFSTQLHVELVDHFGPFLYPNQYCWFSPDSAAVSQGELVCNPADSDLDAVSLVYNYVLSNITYDTEEAKTVQSGYLPDVDEVLETKKGICLDYASLMSAMLRSQGIPTRMEIGYAGSAYHAWITCYIDEIGWINGIIEFDGSNWSLMDPTLAASQGEKKLAKFIGDGSNYRTVYLY